MLKDWSSSLVKNETLFLMCQKIFVNGINSLCSVELSPNLWAQVPVELSRIPYSHSRKCKVQCKEGTVLHLLQPIQLGKDNSQQTSKLPLFTPFSSHKLTLDFFLAICYTPLFDGCTVKTNVCVSCTLSGVTFYGALTITAGRSGQWW